MSTEAVYQLAAFDRKGNVSSYATIPDDIFTRSLVIPFRWSKHSKTTEYLKRWKNGKNAYLHREIYEIYYGPIPEGKEIDHADRNAKNNLPGNLRAVTHGANVVNSGRRGASGFHGVRKMRSGWQARISRNGQTFCLGVFPTKEEAFSVRQKAEKEHYPELHVPISK